jgi:hypothetical protein
MTTYSDRVNHGIHLGFSVVGRDLSKLFSMSLLYFFSFRSRFLHSLLFVSSSVLFSMLNGSLFSFVSLELGFLENLDSLSNSELVVGRRVSLGLFQSFFECFSCLVNVLSCLFDSSGVLSVGFLQSHSFVHCFLGFLLLSLQITLGFGNGRVCNLLGLFEFLLDVLGSFSNSKVLQSKFVSEHVVSSTLVHELGLSFREALLLED